MAEVALTTTAESVNPPDTVAAIPDASAAAAVLSSNQPTPPEEVSVVTHFFGFFGSASSAPVRKFLPINTATKRWALEGSEAAASRLCSLDAPASLPFTPEPTQPPPKQQLSEIYSPADAILIDVDQDWRGVKKVVKKVTEPPAPEKPPAPTPKKNCLIS